MSEVAEPGPGKYDSVCETARDLSDAETILLFVINGNKGSGFSVTTKNPLATLLLPDLLRDVANQIEGYNRQVKGD